MFLLDGKGHVVVDSAEIYRVFLKCPKTLARLPVKNIGQQQFLNH